MGKAAIIVHPGKHLGGMTSNGLGATDIGNKKAIGGISREFYQRLGKHYGQDEAWTFEPHVAEDTYNKMVADSADSGSSSTSVSISPVVSKNESGRIVAITMESGRRFAPERCSSTPHMKEI